MPEIPVWLIMSAQKKKKFLWLPTRVEPHLGQRWEWDGQLNAALITEKLGKMDVDTGCVFPCIMALDTKVKWVQKVPAVFKYQINKVMRHGFWN